jgi:arylsulfatase A-like enzyme
LNESTATIYAMIEVMDQGIGELLSELDRLKLSRRTVVIFASDNGPDPRTGTRFNQNLRGTKYNIHEGGIRVPLLVRWKDHWNPGTRTTPIHFVDLFPTILDICKIKYRANLPIDGLSFQQLLETTDKNKPTRQFWQWNRGEPNYTHNAAVREGDWKLVKPFVTGKAHPKDSSRKAVLYHLSNDPEESVDLSRKFPNRYKKMQQLLQQWSTDVETDRKR